MDAYAVHIAAAPETARLSRLSNDGWHVLSPVDGVQIALAGRAGLEQTGPWIAVGLAALNDAAAPRADRAEGKDSDLARIAALRAHHGPAFPDHLSGGFSVVLINADTGQIEAYRDHFGIIPLYHTVHDGGLTCSSDIRAALHVSKLPLEQNPIRIADFLMANDVDPVITAFSGLSRLPAAHALTWTGGTLDIQRYWALSLPEQISAEEAPRALRAVLEQATAHCLEPDTQTETRTGAMLSGGLDSSSLACLAAGLRKKAGQTALPTLSFTYGADSPMDESVYIDAANASAQTAPIKIPLSSAPCMADITALIEEQMDLFLGFGMQKSRAIYRVAAENGLSVLIDGHGGDEVISQGYGRFIELAASRNWLRLFFEMRGIARMFGDPYLGAYFLNIARHGGLAPKSILRRVLLRAARLLIRGKAVGVTPAETAEILAPGLRDRVAPDTRYTKEPDPTSRDALMQIERKKHLDTLTDPLLQSAFELLHRSAVAQGVLPRYPFFDKAVVEFCLAVPSEAKLKDGLSRWVLREAMRGVLPEKIRTRTTKTDFTAEFRATVLDHLKDEGPDAFEGLERYIDPAAVQRLYQSLSGSDAQNVAKLRLWWRLAVLAHWEAAFETWRTLQARGELI